jgi:hypothetical protein
MAAEEFDFAIFALRKEIGRRGAQCSERLKHYRQLAEKAESSRVRLWHVRAVLDELHERDREIAELRAAIKRLGR